MKQIALIALFSIALSAIGQVSLPVIMADTTINGSKFIYQFNGHFRVDATDSINANGVKVPGFCSLLSYAVIHVEKQRIINGDTIRKVESVVVPLADVQNRYNTMINSVEFKRAFKRAIKAYSIRKRINEE